MLQLPLTYILIGITVITSLAAFSNHPVMDDLIFYPPAVTRRKQWWRFITCGFIHADTGHLVFNMISFYFFGKQVEETFISLFGDKGKLLFLLLYFSSLVVCLLPTYFKNRHNAYYKSLGASGAVSAIIFAGICIAPTVKISIMPIPFGIPGFLFGIIYLVGCIIMDRRKSDNINHSAHLWGALYGVAFFFVACFALTDVNPATYFVQQVTQYFQSF